MSRRLRQLDELRELCRNGAAARAVDLAFQHVADFDLDDDIVELLVAALARPGTPENARRRFAELRRSRR